MNRSIAQLSAQLRKSESSAVALAESHLAGIGEAKALNAFACRWI